MAPIAWLFCFALLGASSLGAADRPNILFLFADDQRADTIGAYGNPHIRTPNLDRLARQGFNFRNAYCMGSDGGAVCVPSRAMLNSGKAYFRIPMDLAGEKLLGQVLRENGYATFATGKWHNQETSWLRSFSRGRSIFFGGMSDHTNVPLRDLNGEGRLVDPGPSRVFSSQLFADAVIDFLKGHQDRDTPFYAYVAFTAPHDPRQPPLRYREEYYHKRPPLPINFLPQHPFDNGNMTGRDEELGAWPRTEKMIRDQLSEYYGLVTHLDEQVGRILQALEASPHARNTVVIYAADHGLAVGSHGLLGKQNIYEHSMKAPLIVKGPGVPAGSTQALTYLLDIYPTILALAGVTPPVSLDGGNLAPVWEGRQARLRDTLFLGYRHLMRSVRDERWKLIRYPHIDHTQLFDLERDPHEVRNLADEAGQAGRVQAMLAKLAEWQRSLGDTQPLTVPDPKPKAIDMTGHKRNVDRWQPMWIIEKYWPTWF